MLTDKEEKFCNNFVSGMNQSDAYREAYDNNMTDKQIWEEASKLMKKPKVIQRITELRDKASDKAIKSAIERKIWLTNQIDDEDNSLNDRLKALDILNKMDGEYITKIDADVRTDIIVEFDDYDEDTED